LENIGLNTNQSTKQLFSINLIYLIYIFSRMSIGLISTNFSSFFLLHFCLISYITYESLQNNQPKCVHFL
jgi:hypothetical protein